MKKAAIFSGGGSMGAFTVGRLKKLNKNYDTVIGCSTGSLIATLAILGEWDRLEKAYTSVTQEKIFNVNPFNKEGNIKLFHSLWRILSGHKTLGETKNLKKLIQENFTVHDYHKILKLNKNIIVTVCNLENVNNSVEYKSIRDYDYEEFVNYIWASCNVPLVTSLLETKNGTFVDGGVAEVSPIQKIFKLGETPEEIDCFTHILENNEEKKDKVKNIFNLSGRLINILRNEIIKDDILVGQQLAKINNTKLNIYYLPYKLTNNSLIFDKKEMTEWVKKGYESI